MSSTDLRHRLRELGVAHIEDADTMSAAKLACSAAELRMWVLRRFSEGVPTYPEGVDPLVVRCSEPSGEAVYPDWPEVRGRLQRLAYPFEIRLSSQAVFRKGKLIGWKGDPQDIGVVEDAVSQGYQLDVMD